MQYSQEHLKTMVYAKFGGQTECIMGNWKIENFNFCPRKYEDAVETAFAQKSEEGLDLILGKCATSNRPLVNRIQEMKAKLWQRR